MVLISPAIPLRPQRTVVILIVEALVRTHGVILMLRDVAIPAIAARVHILADHFADVIVVKCGCG
jgi:hypothetical protein